MVRTHVRAVKNPNALPDTISLPTAQQYEVFHSDELLPPNLAPVSAHRPPALSQTIPHYCLPPMGDFKGALTGLFDELIVFRGVGRVHLDEEVVGLTLHVTAAEKGSKFLVFG